MKNLVELLNLEPAESEGPVEWSVGDLVWCNGYEGRVVEKYTEGMWNVKMNRGTVCVSGSELKQR